MYNRADASIEHRRFYDLPEYLNKGDALVLNETRVIPARLLGNREDTGGAIEFLLLRRIDLSDWEVLVKPGRRAPEGARFAFGGGLLRAVVLARTDAGGRIVRFECDGALEQALDELGRMPLPPYIHAPLEDRERYQTVYAKYEGSAAAPTAGLHFTPHLLKALEDKGVHIARVLLHVGLGTFRPVKEENLKDHVMHAEYYEVGAPAAEAINRCRAAGGRVVPVGTTAVRTLETVADEQGRLTAGQGMTDIFITPGYRFRACDALITNFHLPESTLLMLVSALMGREEALRAYREAIGREYRFFSFGDAMLIRG